MMILCMALALATVDAGPEVEKKTNTAPSFMAPSAARAPDAQLHGEDGMTRLTINGAECDDPSDLGRTLAYDAKVYRCARRDTGNGSIIMWNEQKWRSVDLDGGGKVTIDWWQLGLLLVTVLVLPFFVRLALARSKTIRNDGDPSNDWQADLWDAARALAEAGDIKGAVNLLNLGSARAKAEKEKKRAPR